MGKKHNQVTAAVLLTSSSLYPSVPDFNAPPSPFYITYQKRIVTDLNWNLNQREPDFQLDFVCWCYIFLYMINQTFSRPNMGRPSRMVKGYTVTFGRARFISPHYGLVSILVLQLEILNEVQSLILVASSRSDATTICARHYWTVFFFIPYILEVQISGLRTSHRLFFPRMIYSFTVIVWTEYSRLS